MSKFCTNCGCELPDSALNCPNCGTPVDNSQNNQQNAGGQPYNPSSNQIQTPAYSQQPQQPLVPCPTTKEFLKYIAFPTLLSFVTCGIGGLILMIVWACDNNNIVRRNFSRAYLIWEAIAIGVVIVFYIILFAVLIATGNNIFDSYHYGSFY